MQKPHEDQRHSASSLQLFYCYARKDQAFRDELDKHLAGLRRRGLITSWYDGMIVPGASWEKEIAIHLDTADIILLLISPDFMNSDNCYSREMRRAIEHHENQEAPVIPILVRSVYWSDAPFSHLQILPTGARPVTRWDDADTAFEDVTRGILRVAQDLNTHRQLQKQQAKDNLLQHNGPSQSLTPSITDSALYAQKMQEETKTISNRERQHLFPSLIDASKDRVVVVPARIALDEYLKYSIYFCQPNRSFQPSVRMAFYTHNKIDRHVAKIRGYVKAIVRDEIESRSDLSEYERVQLRLLYSKLDHARSEKWHKERNDVYFLTPPDSPDTLILPQDIENDTISHASPIKRVAFTQNQRYISLSLLEQGPKYISELDAASSGLGEE